ncbi:unnamed protein product [Mytilus edulis]|uniref:Uncharacterized protein n=1 Tax=Mytilus edulis TaxID=6550 RepID=A0A8S3R8W2_MYTED|nr:unnamed protein product [Mytilus edulis]
MYVVELLQESCTNDCGQGNQTFHGKWLSYEQSFTFPCVNYSGCSAYKWGHLKELNLTRADLKELMKEELDELKKNLTIDSKNISATIRKRICARDDRPSAVSVGYVGVALLLIPLVIIISFDVPKYFVVVTNIYKRVSKRKDVNKARVQLKKY